MRAIVCFALLFHLAFLCAQESIVDMDKEKICRALEKAFAQELETLTGRKNIVLVIEGHILEAGLKLVPGRRSSREIFLSMMIRKGKEGYELEGKWFPLVTEKTLVAALQEALDKAFIKYVAMPDRANFAIVVSPCANLYVEPKKEEGDNLASQLLHGAWVSIFESTLDNDFLRVHSEQDGYIGWIAKEDIRCLEGRAFVDAREAMKVYLQEPFHSLPVGAGVFLEGNLARFYHPGPGRELREPIEGNQYVNKEHKATPDSIEATARQFLEKPDWSKTTYLWGGACIPKLDCSGFVQLVYRLNNILLPRDSDQQYQFSQPVALSEIQKGDLIFFSKHGRHPTHVGIYLGEGVYIHCSAVGEKDGVKLNRIEGESDYEKYLRSIVFGVGRILK